MSLEVLNNLFTKRTLDDLTRDGRSDVYERAALRYVKNACGLSNREVLSALYGYMKSKYRNEFIYKDALLKKIVFGIHSPNTSTAINELPIAGSIADFTIVNGHATVYEIKTDLDNLSRLDDQITDYYKAFRYVNVICSEQLAGFLCEKYSGWPIGVCALTRRGSISKRRDAREHRGDLDALAQFDLLRKGERELVLKQAGFALPETTPARLYRESLAIFRQIPEKEREPLFERALKTRGRSVDVGALGKYPDEFKLVAYTHRATRRQADELRAFLDSAFRGRESHVLSYPSWKTERAACGAGVGRGR